MIALDQVTKTYPGDVKALKGISLQIKKGEFVFVVGQSGSGKTTLFKLLLKEMEPTSGTIYINNKNLGRLRRRRVPKLRRGIGVVFQDFRLLKDRNVYENIAFAQQVVGAPNRLIKKNVMAMLKLVGLPDKAKSYPNELSGGEQQRVALARALVNNPPLLLADEPTGALDRNSGLEVLKLFQHLSDMGNTIVMITHDLSVAQHAERVVRIVDGELFEEGII